MNTIGSNIGSKSTNVSGSRATSTGLGTGGGQAVTNAGAVRQAAPISGNMLLSQMMPGSTFSGDIIDVRGSAIKLLLTGEKTLNAATTDANNLNIGDHITFNVTSNNGSTVVIKPVKVNSFNTNVLLKALEAAELPPTDKNLEMVKSMMKHEMSIDKKSVLDMLKKVETLKADNPEHVVSMDKHGIPLTKENVSQFAAYKNYEHRIMAQAESMSGDIPDMLAEMTAAGSESKAVSIAKELINIFNSSLLDGGSDVSQSASVHPSVDNTNQDVQANTQINTSDNMTDGDMEYLKNIGLLDDGDTYIYEQSSHKRPTVMSYEQMLNNLNTLSGDELKEFFNSDEFKTFIKDRIERSFELDINKLVEDGEDSKETVKKLYKNLDNKTEALVELLVRNNENDSKLAQTANNIRQNMQFMQDLSSMASYVQLPIKFNDSKAHGDLYVFNRKKGMPVDKDVVTAFLHLDMDSLGATDVHVTMERNMVSIKFGLEDDESVRIVETHLPSLAEKLSQKGYTTTFTVENDSDVKNTTPFDKVLETDKPQIAIKRYSFDVRA